jgi:hypothetical protein
MKLKHLQLWENWSDGYDPEDDDSHLTSFDYFVETYLNGQFRQLREMLDRIKDDAEYDNLTAFLTDNGYNKIIDWLDEVALEKPE